MTAPIHSEPNHHFPWLIHVAKPKGKVALVAATVFATSFFVPLYCPSAFDSLIHVGGVATSCAIYFNALYPLYSSRGSCLDAFDYV